MTKKTRLIIFLSCIACFIIVAPILVAYSLGYKFDFVNMKVVATGGIYVRTFPSADKILVDSNGPEKPGLFSNSIFVQGLLPKTHTVSIEKTGYYSYQKTLPVKEKEVTKIEDVLLIKEHLVFSAFASESHYFSVAKNNQNILAVKHNASSINLSYLTTSNPDQQTSFTIIASGRVTDIQWSDDSRFALIKVTNTNNATYYIFDTNLAKPTANRLAFLDINSKKISFNSQNSTQLFYLENNNIYLYSNVTSSEPKVTIAIKGALDYSIINNGIIWLSTKGILNQSDLAGTLQQQLTKEPINPLATNYTIFSMHGTTFLQQDNLLFALIDSKLTAFISPESSYKTIPSPDNKHLLYVGINAIHLYSFDDKKYTKIYSGNNITDTYWLNNFYIIVHDGSNIIISEIDYRGNINAITLPSEVTFQDDTVGNIVASKIFYNRQDNKLYILSEDTLISSEKLVP